MRAFSKTIGALLLLGVAGFGTLGLADDDGKKLNIARARDLGVPFDGRTGPNNAITDVPGIEVGHTTLISGDGKLVVGQGPVRTGVTAILPRGKTYDPVLQAGSP